MNPSRFQFTIKGLLWATFWVAIGAAAFCYPRSRSGFNYYYAYGPYLEALQALIAVACLCPAVGALMGSHAKGIQFGLIVIGSCLAWAAVLKLGDFYPFAL